MTAGQPTSEPRPNHPELSIVMPVYNGEATIGAVVRSWMDELDRLRIRYEFLVYDDGSGDGTPDVLAAIAKNEQRLVVRRHANMGHGPTILRGYEQASGEWVFQTDSDNETTPAGFEPLWRARGDSDVLFGCRQDRHSTFARRTISAGARTVVRVLFGAGLWDVNTPYRLMRRSALRAMVARIPPLAFAPNVLIAGLAVREQLRIRQTWVTYQPRHDGKSSLGGVRQWRAAVQAALETVSVALRSRTKPSPIVVSTNDGD
jgi:dolichol-phosphate mannosyltransferase